MKDFDYYLEKAQSKKERLQAKIAKVMDEWKAGTLKSGSGDKVTDQKQALAIAYSQFRDTEKKAKKS